MVKKKLPVRYNDQMIRILLCVIAAFLVAMYGTGARFLDSLSQGSFYIKLLAAFLIACFFIEFVHRVTVQLDKGYDWKERPMIRLTLQFALGVLLPGIIDFFFLSIYQWYFELTSSPENPGYHSSIPAMMLPVFLFNIYYLFYYQILRNREGNTHTKTEMEILLVQQGTKTIPMELQNIRFIYHQDRMNYLVTSNQTTYFLNETLDELERKLPSRDFFRINRKMIIHYQACVYFRSNGHGKLLLHLSPSFPEEVTVSQNRAGKFKEWIRR
ncbi:LytR/AlgR family response regulator transcription factor [Algoriphagus resistens]|uniref:LytR/AlgR family response regulator transcription factor n=1 Tax=Algoriphagus resistens TaxID=1750590 RepID=UPI0012FC9B26|nr:LytTR family DNA-binding domain-containing protein [Algoriphagus resistens]